MPNEIELKLRISSADVPRLRRHPALLAALTDKPVTRKLTSMYYDTPQLTLLDAGISLRVRRMSGGWFQAVKAAGHSSVGLHQRMEWEDIIAFGHPDFSKINEPALIRIFDAPALRSALTPIFTTEVRRTEWHLAWSNGDRIELALDLGDLIVGENREPISEIELELKGGQTRRLFELALALQQDLTLELENISKAQRGYAHYRPRPPAIAKAQPIDLDPQKPACEAFRRIAWECLAQLQGNQDMVLHGDDVEGVHQMRVALRRLRSAMNVFGEVLHGENKDLLLTEIRWLAEILGRARDLDVLLTQTLPSVMRRIRDHDGLEQLRTKAQAEQFQAYAEARNALGSQRHHRLLLSLGAWLEQIGTVAPDHETPTTLAVAQARLTQRYKQLCKHGKRLSEMQPEERHATRIAAKKLRYAAEFVVCLFPGEKTRRFLRSLGELQSILGELNDIATTDHLVRQLIGARPNRALDESLQLLTGWNACNTVHRIENMEKVWRSFARRSQFWQ